MLFTTQKHSANPRKLQMTNYEWQYIELYIFLIKLSFVICTLYFNVCQFYLGSHITKDLTAIVPMSALSTTYPQLFITTFALFITMLAIPISLHLPLFLNAFTVFSIVGIYYLLQPLAYQHFIDINILSTFTSFSL